MKYISSIILICITQFVVAQSIVQLRTVPSSPLSTDTVYVLADLQFPSSDCVLDTKSHQINGNTISASSHHCVGIATAICNATDTFKLGVLGSGSYTFSITLTNGGGQVPCSPGIVISDMDTLTFSVQSSLGIKDVVLPSFSVYPNPAQDFVRLSDAYHPIAKTVKIVAVTGAVVVESDTPKEKIDVSGLTPGVYTIEIYHNTGMATAKFVKE